MASCQGKPKGLSDYPWHYSYTTSSADPDGRFIGINTEAAEDTGFHAPLLRKGSKLRLARPEERNEKRLENPQTE
jgi:hypothetical protein